MTILDVNVLLYASISAFPQHAAARAWLGELVEDPDTIGLAWVTIWGYLRLATSSLPFATSVRPEDAFAFMRKMLAIPGVHVIDPGPRHLDLLRELAIGGQSTGSKMSDAVLAAMAIERGATLASTDKDFSRFPKLRWVDPLG